MNRIPLALLFASGLLFAGCATHTTYLPWEGSQHWSVSDGAFVNRQYRLPIYSGPPGRPYEVLGLVRVQVHGQPEHDAVREAVKHGADALFPYSSEKSAAGTYGYSATEHFGWGPYSASVTQTSSHPRINEVVSYLAIRFVPKP